MGFKFIAPVLCLLMIVGYASGNACLYKVNKCYTRILQLQHQQETGGVFTPKALNSTELDHMCRLYEEGKACVRRIRYHCTSAELKLFEVLDSMMQYLCAPEKKAILLSISQCMSNPAILTEVNTCQANFKADMAQLRYKSISEILQGTCIETHKFSGCFTRVIKAHCGDKAAQYYKGLLDVTFKTALEQAHCERYEEKPTPVPTAEHGRPIGHNRGPSYKTHEGHTAGASTSFVSIVGVTFAVVMGTFVRIII